MGSFLVVRGMDLFVLFWASPFSSQTSFKFFLPFAALKTATPLPFHLDWHRPSIALLSSWDLACTELRSDPSVL